jgi:phage-related protein
VLHAFQKKTRKTSGHDIDLARQRYRHIGGNL